MDLQTVSVKVYIGLCLEIGTSKRVKIRRDVIDIKELIDDKVRRDNNIITRIGGQREGFRLEGSDNGTMSWPNHYRGIWIFSQFSSYIKHCHSLIFCDSSESPPGYTLLFIHPMEACNIMVLLSLVRINGDFYISSAKYKDNMCALKRPDSTVHGPCNSGRFDDLFDYDEAHSFVSGFWPPSASSWIERCYSWPPPRVVDDIIRSGCHFVAIGNKNGNHVDNEWRISFSIAERKLVYAMNHTQFLTYALLKLLVKDINKGCSEEEKLLSSYHTKTAILWTIQQNTRVHWCPRNLISNFWICFKLLLKWVYEGVCPNFFIPENNMFLNKVYGAAQRNLFAKLYRLYEKGEKFALQIPSISTNIHLNMIICDPILSASCMLGEDPINSEALLDRTLFGELLSYNTLHYYDIHHCFNTLNKAEQLIQLPLTQCQVAIMQKITSTILQVSAFMLHDMYPCTPGGNKQMYITDKITCYMLKLASKFGLVSDLLYIALYFYKTSRHREASCIIAIVNDKLEHPGLMYMGNTDLEKYTRHVAGQSFSKKMRNAVAQYIILDNNIFYITELIPEQQSGLRNNRKLLHIPPVILLHMLEFLCCRHVDHMKAQVVLSDLKRLIHHDQGESVDTNLQNISWEILGICQEIAGNYQAALYSYQQALKHSGFPKIRSATEYRIKELKNTIAHYSC